MVEFINYRLDLQLEAQTPLIHFQANESNYQEHLGVTLRASEVKPKLDRFLIRKLEKLDEWQAGKSSSFFRDAEHKALNYKMAIENKQESKLVELSPQNKEYKYELYYGNMNKQREERKMGVFSNPVVTIFCMVANLRKLIQKYIVEFFLVTNFGTMQNKGFGSFLPKDCEFNGKLDKKQKEEVADFLLNDVIESMTGTRKGKKVCYGMEFEIGEQMADETETKNKNCVNIFKEIKQFYGIMKSGQNYCGFARSYIYDYMHTQNIDNEKAWMKQSGISPIVHTKNSTKMREDRRDVNPKYVRALLGTTESISYIEKAGKRDKVPITISFSDGSFRRVSSPIYFKVIKNVVFIVAREVPKEIYGQEFGFENESWKKQGNLKTPDKFDIDEFLEQYVKYYNTELRSKVHNMDRNKKVVAIKCVDMSELQ